MRKSEKNHDNQCLTVGDRLAKYRKYLSLSQKDAAKRFGVGRNTWNRYESLDREPKPPVLALLARSGLNLTWLLEGENAGPMLLEGSDVREHQADYALNLSGDPDAQDRIQQRSKATLEQIRKYADELESIFSELNYHPSDSWMATFQELMFVHHVRPTTIKRIIETLKAEESRRKNESRFD